MNNVVNKSPLLRGSREFPEEAKELTQEVNKAYLEIATAVNDRTIGLYPVNRPAITGNKWYLTGNKTQDTLRQVYALTGTSAVTHGIALSGIAGFVSIYGTFTDGTNWYPLPYVHPTAANQIGLIITSTQITFSVGASAPTVSSGFVVLEYLSL